LRNKPTRLTLSNTQGNFQALADISHQVAKYPVYGSDEQQDFALLGNVLGLGQDAARDPKQVQKTDYGNKCGVLE
jgi:hypothetical protein